MIKVFNEIRTEERRTVFGAFLTLFAIMVSHALLETARDALFLAKVSSTQLPWVYMGIAVLAFLLLQIENRFLKKFESRIALTVLLIVSALITVAVWLLLYNSGTWIYYIIYLWSGVMSTMVVVRFWALVSDLFTVTQAKRLFAAIGTGSVLGAITGSALARFLTNSLPTEHLIPVAAGLLLVASFMPFLFRNSAKKEEPSNFLDKECDTETGCLKNILSRPYVSRLLALVISSTIALTFIDYLFKSIVAKYVPANELGAFFSQTYLILNIISLIIQLAVVQQLIKYFGLNRSLITTPILLLVTITALLGVQIFAVGFILSAMLAVKGVDGSLRYSLNRTTAEMLYVPLSREVRAHAKSFIDILGQRGGQALASLLILLLVFLGSGFITLTILTIIVVSLWIFIGFELRHHYLNLFRDSLKEGHFETQIEYPELDIASLETLIETLNSPKDTEVLAALEFLDSQDRVRLIPVMILYHPSPEIVITTLKLFTKAGRKDFFPIAERLCKHSNPLIRAATIRAMCSFGSEKFHPIEQFVEDPSPAVRATALVGLISANWLEGENAKKVLYEFASSDLDEERIALAEAIAEQPSDIFAPALIEIASAKESEVRLAATKAMETVRHESFLPTLLEMLADRKYRESATSSLSKMGKVALKFLEDALNNPETPLTIRRHIPKTLRGFSPIEASEILLQHLINENDGLVRYKILRALNAIRQRNPNLPLNKEILVEACNRTLSGVFRLLNWRIHIMQATADAPSRKTPVQDVIVSTLKHKENEAIERLFRLLGLLYPEEDFQKIYAGIQSDNASLKSSSLELLEAIIENPLRDGFVGYLDAVSSSEKLSFSGIFYTPSQMDYSSVLSELLNTGGLALRSLTAYHIGELGMSELQENLTELESERSTFLNNVVVRARELLSGQQQRGLVYD